MNPSEQLTHIRTLGKARSAKHYAANKDKVNERRRHRYAVLHGLPVPPPVPPPILPPVPPVPPPVLPVLPPVPPPVLTPVPPALPPVLQPAQIVKKGKKTIQSKNVLYLAIVQQKIKDLNIENKKTEKKYLDDIQRTMTMTQCNDLNECLKKPKNIIELVNNSKKRNGENYSENTKNQYFKAYCLSLIS